MPIGRTKLWSFFKLVTGVHVAVALSCLSFVNQRVAESVIGHTESVTLIDYIHLTAMVFIFAIALVGIRVQTLFDRERKDEAAALDIRGLWITAIAYVAANLALIGVAALRG